MVLLLSFFISCSKNTEEWSDIFIDEKKSSYQTDYCDYNNIYMQKPVTVKYKNKKINIIGVSSRTCKDKINGLVVIDRYYALVNNNQNIEEKLRIVFPAYMSLSTGDNSFYKKYREEKYKNNFYNK